MSEFALSPTTVENLQRASINTLFPVQVESFEAMTNGRDIVGCSKTGSGKTLAFALPIVEKIQANLAQQTTRGRSDSKRSVQALVTLPTRELAQQVLEEFQRIAPQLSCVNVVGGVSYTAQTSKLRRGADIVVCTPGRIVDLLQRGDVDLSTVQTAVLDEADMMLEIGFKSEIETIMKSLPSTRQTVLWSATFPSWVKQVTKQYLTNPEWIDLVGDEETKIPVTVEQKAIVVTDRNRVRSIGAVLEKYANGGQTLIFTETKREVEDLVRHLKDTRIRGLHGDLSQSQRTERMSGFRKRDFDTLVCTDIAARGLDISSVDLVLQYRLPTKIENFVHRTGRTGRAGRSGVNIVLFGRQDMADLQKIERDYGIQFTHVGIPNPEEILSEARNKTLKRLLEVRPSITTEFESTSEALLEQHGTSALSAALAILSGYEKGLPQHFSLLTGKPRFRTLLVSGASKRQVETHFKVPFDEIYPMSSSSVLIDLPSHVIPNEEELTTIIPGCTMEFPTSLERLFGGARLRGHQEHSFERESHRHTRGFARNRHHQPHRFRGQSSDHRRFRDQPSHNRRSSRNHENERYRRGRNF